MDRNEYLLFNKPAHTFAQYATAHALAGDLKLEDADKPAPATVEQVAVLARLSRSGNK